TEVGEVTHEADVEFIELGGIERLRIAQSQQLRPAGGNGIEAGNAGTTLRPGIRIIEIEVVEKVVRVKQSPSAIAIDADRAFIVAHRLVEGRSSEAGRRIRSRDVLQHSLRRDGPRTLRNHRV